MDAPKNDPVPPSERFRWALKTLFDGSQSRMASVLGCSQPTISRILAGVNDPGPKLLAALAGLPGVDSQWALTGTGSPTQTHCLAVAHDFLPGCPDQFPAMLTGRRVFFPAEKLRTLYVVVVQASMTIVDHGSRPIQQGDSVIIEADPGAWRDNLAALEGRLCAVRTGPKGQQTVGLHRVRCLDDGSGGIRLEILDRVPPSSEIERERVIDVSEPNSEPYTKVQPIEPPLWIAVDPKQITGIVRLIFREPDRTIY